MILILLIFIFAAHFKGLSIITLFLLGAVGFGMVSPLQIQVMQKAKGAPTLASAVNISAFNLGVSLGVFLGGTAIHLGLGYTSPNWVGAILTFLGLLIFLFSNFIFKR